MLARKEEVGSRKTQAVAREAIDGVAADASTATITTATGHVMAVSEFVAGFGTYMLSCPSSSAQIKIFTGHRNGEPSELRSMILQTRRRGSG